MRKHWQIQFRTVMMRTDPRSVGGARAGRTARKSATRGTGGCPRVAHANRGCCRAGRTGGERPRNGAVRRSRLRAFMRDAGRTWSRAAMEALLSAYERRRPVSPPRRPRSDRSNRRWRDPSTAGCSAIDESSDNRHVMRTATNVWLDTLRAILPAPVEDIALGVADRRLCANCGEPVE